MQDFLNGIDKNITLVPTPKYLNDWRLKIG